MIWLTYRQHRTQAAVTLAIALLIASYFLWAGLRAQSLADELDLSACPAGPASEVCDRARVEFSERFSSFSTTAPYANFLLALVAVFWGAPLVAREIENGTSRLVWTQGVSRLRWLSTKLVAILAGAALLGAIQGVLFWWWYGTIGPVVESRFAYEVFDLQGVAPIGYALFAAAGGVAAGVVLPRTLPAMILAAAGYVAVRLAVSRFLRADYMDPLQARTDPFTGPPLATGDWFLEGYFVSSDGEKLSFRQVESACPPRPGTYTCFTEAGIKHVDFYQPSDRFWSFQVIELGIFLALTATMVGFALWRIRSAH